jgi:hypothetical protein
MTDKDQLIIFDKSVYEKLKKLEISDKEKQVIEDTIELLERQTISLDKCLCGNTDVMTSCFICKKDLYGADLEYHKREPPHYKLVLLCVKLCLCAEHVKDTSCDEKKLLSLTNNDHYKLEHLTRIFIEREIAKSENDEKIVEFLMEHIIGL